MTAQHTSGSPVPPPPHLSREARAILSDADDHLSDLADYRAARTAINRIADTRCELVRKQGVQFDVDAVDANGVRAYWITSPPQDDSERVILYAHGGGYVAGEAARVIEHPLRMGRAAGRPVLSVEYRRAPEHPWPAAFEDCLTAHCWLVEQGYAPGRIAWTGLSAGGGIVLAMGLAARQRGIPMPGAIYGMSPWADLTLSGDSYRTNAPYDHVMGSTDMERLAGMYAGYCRPPRTHYFTHLRRSAGVAADACGRRLEGNAAVGRPDLGAAGTRCQARTSPWTYGTGSGTVFTTHRRFLKRIRSPTGQRRFFASTPAAVQRVRGPRDDADICPIY